MADNIVHIGDATESSFSFSPMQLLQSVADEIERGELAPKRALIILLDDGADGTYYDVFCRMAQLRHSECLALMDYAKHMLLDTMYRGDDS